MPISSLENVFSLLFLKVAGMIWVVFSLNDVTELMATDDEALGWAIAYLNNDLVVRNTLVK